MHYRRWLIAGALAAPLAGWTPALPQDGAPMPRPAEQTDAAAAAADSAADSAAVAAEDADDLLGEDELDELVAPIALYPDALLAQIFVAATYPLDVMKADRFIDDNEDLSDKERNAKAETEDWDPSLAALVGGFPTVVQKMADEIDWTERLGDAMLAQTDDVLDAVQRQRSRAVATGYLTSNEAQTVETEGDSIAIEPTDPDVVYVPSYDATAAYTTAPTAAPVVVEDSGFSTGNVLATGAIAFGSALLIDEIFDDDDDNDYWHGPDHIDWDDDEFYPRGGRGGINADGDVNIDVDRNRNRVRVGDGDVRRDGATGAWKPAPGQKQAARDKLAARERTGAAAGSRGAAGQANLKARSGADQSGARSKLQAANTKRAATGKPGIAGGGGGGGNFSAFDHAGGGSATKAKAAAARGGDSIGRSKLPASSKASAQRVSKPSASSRPKNISKPKSSFKPKSHAAPKSSAFSKSSSGSRAKASSSRGHRSSGGGGGRGGGGGGRGGGGRR